MVAVRCGMVWPISHVSGRERGRGGGGREAYLLFSKCILLVSTGEGVHYTPLYIFPMWLGLRVGKH